MTIGERTAEAVNRDLFAALREGLLLRAAGSYRFSHDRVQQAAYSLVPESDRPAYHDTTRASEGSCSRARPMPSFPSTSAETTRGQRMLVNYHG